MLFLAAFIGFAVGAMVPALRVSRVVHQTAAEMQTYDFNWLIAVLLVYAVLLLVATARKRFRPGALHATIALILSMAMVLLLTRFGIRNTAV